MYKVIKGYKILQSDDAVTLSKHVNKWIERDWYPYSAPFEFKGMLCQTIVQYERKNII